MEKLLSVALYKWRATDSPDVAGCRRLHGEQYIGAIMIYADGFVSSPEQRHLVFTSFISVVEICPNPWPLCHHSLSLSWPCEYCIIIALCPLRYHCPVSLASSWPCVYCVVAPRKNLADALHVLSAIAVVTTWRVWIRGEFQERVPADSVRVSVLTSTLKARRSLIRGTSTNREGVT